MQINRWVERVKWLNYEDDKTEETDRRRSDSLNIHNTSSWNKQVNITATSAKLNRYDKIL